MRRTGSDSDLPALSGALGAINRIASSEAEGVNELSNSSCGMSHSPASCCGIVNRRQGQADRPEKELSLLKSLCNQAVSAIRQSL